ncbi:MAG: hypothetical protein WCP03_01180 [Candidatus Saccharibacteria bacterium]
MTEQIPDANTHENYLDYSGYPIGYIKDELVGAFHHALEAGSLDDTTSMISEAKSYGMAHGVEPTEADMLLNRVFNERSEKQWVK